MTDIDYKINKYTNKLKHATSTSDAEASKRKLREYNKMKEEMYGGGNIDDLNDLQDRFNKHVNELLEISKGITQKLGINTDELTNNLALLSNKIESIRNTVNDARNIVQTTVSQYNEFNKNQEQLEEIANNVNKTKTQLNDIQFGIPQSTLNRQGLEGAKKFLEDTEALLNSTSFINELLPPTGQQNVMQVTGGRKAKRS